MKAHWTNLWSLPWTWWGQTTYLRAGLVVARARTSPHKIQSPSHTNAKAALSVLSHRFATPGTPVDVEGWNSYAATIEITPNGGTPYTLFGKEAYIRNNRPRLLAGLPPIDTAPTSSGLPSITVPTYEMSPDRTAVSVAWSTADDWYRTDGAAMFVWSSIPVNSTRTTPQEVYRMITVIHGSSSSPPNPPTTVPLWMPCPSTSVVTLRVSVTYPDGRLT
jgi:hypothetical protein